LILGEQQKNVDFVNLTAIKMLRLEPEQLVTLMYDIVCQYIIYFFERIGHLFPPGFTIDQAIDLFHVHCHKDQCFFRFASTFIPNIGIVAGQILESLWSNLNSISSTARTATLPHRAEMLDDHACDSNHKKMLAMPETLRSRLLEANEMVHNTDQYYVELSNTVARETLLQWEQEILGAEAMRRVDVKVMDIYAAKVRNHIDDPELAPSGSGSGSGSTLVEDWISFGLYVEEMQYVLTNNLIDFQFIISLELN
jgi:hypothetical protein